MLQDDKEINVVKMENAVLLPEVIRLVDEGHTVTLPLRGFSMRPFLEDGRDKALLRQIAHPEVNQPVLAEIDKGHYVLHRIVKIDGNHVTLRGDGNIGVEHCELQDIKALAIGFLRKGRNKPDMITDRKWIFYSSCWTRLLPVRRYLLAFHRHIWMKIIY
jgi:hypothetical protein